MAHEVISLGPDGFVGSEMHGFQGKTCLKVAAELSAELEKLGIITQLDGIQMKDTAEQVITVQQTALKVEQR